MTAPPPLEGVRVIDLTRVLAGPFATQTLADLGADVIKVEHPSAPDQFRFREPKLAGESAAFMSLNRNKRSITLDLSTSAGREVVLDLIGQADVLVENYTSRVMRGYGLDYASIGSRFPKLIFCSISAYGRSGSRADAPGYDPVIAAESGVAWLGGVADAPPQSRWHSGDRHRNGAKCDDGDTFGVTRTNEKRGRPVHRGIAIR